ncbi:MAG TPA: CHASE3 domain-containing protein [Burkholderiaceae bacterium]
MWTFGRKIAVGFGISFVLLLGIGAVAYRGVDALTKASYSVTHTHQVIEHVVGMLSQLQEAEASQRGFLLTGDESYLDPYNTAVGLVGKLEHELRGLTADNPNQQRRLDEADAVVQARLGELAHNIQLRRDGGLDAGAKAVAAGAGKRTMDTLRSISQQMEAEERELLRQRAEEVELTAERARQTVVAGTVLSLLFVCAAGIVIVRSLASQIGSAVRHIQSSSAELHAAAAQQASSAKESSTSMAEITATISELLATSRQIAESAQQVARVAEQTASAARAGDGTVNAASESIASIRQQVDLVVDHTLELGRKSQQIGAVLDIVSELAEQTNILAINATIEAAGAGESGKRFSVVADEIRKLADRVSGSAKEIRALIDDVRGAVNTTVMATETGAKAVDAGTREFAQVAAVFGQIAGMVVTAMQAAREIELSTKQQATAVEQVNLAVGNSAQAARETEVSLGQTVQTASQLSTLSLGLMRLVQARSA